MIRVLGLGNVLMSDDGFGPYIARVLDAFYEFPDEVEVLDLGTPGLDLTPYLLRADAVIFIDTVTSDGAPGETRVYDREEILRYPPQARTGPHDPALKEALLTVAAAGTGPSIVKLIGVIPEWVATGVTLSSPVYDAVTPVVTLVMEELGALGIQPIPRPVPRSPHIWWGMPEGKVPHAIAE
ncbi:MAG TPA: hydrogenase maturation protease [Vicinamibacterales bacterium]|jgi:hydrogenase maturation protease|nr:hydrogenase maturation protease [Vicinamibacterales bacterium]